MKVEEKKGKRGKEKGGKGRGKTEGGRFCAARGVFTTYHYFPDMYLLAYGGKEKEGGKGLQGKEKKKEPLRSILLFCLQRERKGGEKGEGGRLGTGQHCADRGLESGGKGGLGGGKVGKRKASGRRTFSAKREGKKRGGKKKRSTPPLWIVPVIHPCGTLLSTCRREEGREIRREGRRKS